MGGIEDTYTSLLDKFNDEKTMFKEGFWQDLVNVTCVATGAEASYLGKKDSGLDGIEGEVIQYDAISDGSAWVEAALDTNTVSMKDKLLTKGMGVTWGALEDTPEAGFPEDSFKPDPKELPEDAIAKFLWKPSSEVEAAKARAEAENATPPPDPLPEVVRLPQYPVNIECVTDNPSIHYFNMTRLGAYLAVPLVYKSYYTGNALNEAKDFLKKRRKEEEDAAAKLDELR